MRRVLKCSAFAVLGLVPVAAALLVQTWYFKPLSVDWLYARSFLKFALDQPEMLTELRILEPFGIRSHNARLTDASDAHDTLVYSRFKDDYATLHRYDASGYKGQERLSYEIFDQFLGIQVRGERWRYHNHPVNQLFGVQSDLPNLMTERQQVNESSRRKSPSTR